MIESEKNEFNNEITLLEYLNSTYLHMRIYRNLETFDCFKFIKNNISTYYL